MESADHCPNCSQPLSVEMKFCPNCGQENTPVLISVKSIFLDLMSSFYSFDSNFIKTFPLLLFKPGKLTQLFISGQRAAYLSPFRIYLFTSVILFFVISLVWKESNILKANSEDSAAINSEENTNNFFSMDLDSTKYENNPFRDFSFIKVGGEDTEDLMPWYNADSMLNHGIPLRKAVQENFTEQNWLSKLAIGQLLKLKQKDGQGFLSIMMDKLSISLFFFLPLFALLLKLIYFRRRKFYMEHLVFSLHFMSFLFIILTFTILLSVVFRGNWMWFLLFLPIVYLIISQKTVYKQNWTKTTIKFSILGISTIGIFIPVLTIITLIFSLIFY